MSQDPTDTSFNIWMQKHLDLTFVCSRRETSHLLASLHFEICSRCEYTLIMYVVLIPDYLVFLVDDFESLLVLFISSNYAK